MVRYEKILIRIFIKFNENINLNEKSHKNHGGILTTKLLIYHMLIALEY